MKKVSEVKKIKVSNFNVSKKDKEKKLNTILNNKNVKSALRKLATK